MAFAGRAAWTVIAGIAVAAGACDAVLGIRVYPETTGDGGTAGADADVQACGISAGSASCAACIQATCCPQAQACAGSSACAAYEDCVVPCGGDYACRARCLIADYASATEIPEMDQCMAVGCSAECQLACATTASFAEPDAAVGCQSCLTQNDCTSLAKCWTDLDCQEIQQCILGCESEDCVSGCANGREAGAALLTASAVGGASCFSSCSFGTYWDCAPIPTVPTISQGAHATLTLTLTVQGVGPLANATVRACLSTDMDCVAPVVDAGNTDANGNVTFLLAATGFDGFSVGFDGYFEISSPSIYPTLYFLQSGLTASQAILDILVPSPSVVQGYYASYGAVPDASGGVFEVEALDCHWVPAPDVTMTAELGDAGVGLAYFLNGALTTAAPATDLAGFGVLLNAPAYSNISVSVTPPMSRHVSRTATLFTRRATLALMSVHP